MPQAYAEREHEFAEERTVGFTDETCMLLQLYDLQG